MTTELDILESVRRALDALGHGELAQSKKWVPTIDRTAGTYQIECEAYHHNGYLHNFEPNAVAGGAELWIHDWVYWVLVGMGLA